jgi:superfamily II DNA or RNA helicase
MTVEQFHAYMALFRSRSDVYARYWRKGTASGYSPAYNFNWQEFNAHRMRGGSLKDFANKQTVPLTKGVFLQHVQGRLAVGVYPILLDNNCCFLAADFDDKQWLADCQRYVEACRKVGLEAHLERSKSGKGGHVWVFFAKPYPCHKARRIGLSLIRQLGNKNVGVVAREPSFDRLFPNQDLLPAGGYGNLIALPLQGQAVEDGNSVFLDPVTEKPYADQWEYLRLIRPHSLTELNTALTKLDTQYTTDPYQARLLSRSRDSRLRLCVSHYVSLPRTQVSPVITSFLHDKLSFLNPEYLTKKRLGRPIYDVQKYFQLIEETANEILLPRGFLSQLAAFLEAQQIAFVIDHRHAKLRNCPFNSQIVLTAEQERMVSEAMQQTQGILVAPPGSGKTMMAMELIARHEKPALVLVHRRQLLDQWVERIQTYLNIPKSQIGIFTGNVKRTGTQITVGSLQTLAHLQHFDELIKTFGTVIIDECHHIQEKTLRTVVSRLNPEYLYGLTATPKRKHHDEQLLYAYVGNIIATMKVGPKMLTAGVPFEISVRKTALQMPFQWQTDQFELLAKVVCYDTARNQLIVSDILNEVSLGRRVLVLSERKEHLGILELYLKGRCETVLLTGDDSLTLRTAKLRQAETGNYQVLLSTGQLFGEGLGIDNVESLVLAFPFSFEGKLIQYTGRLSHSVSAKALIDYQDSGIAFLDSQFKHRKRYYKKISPAALSTQVHPRTAPLPLAITPFSTANSTADL